MNLLIKPISHRLPHGGVSGAKLTKLVTTECIHVTILHQHHYNTAQLTDAVRKGRVRSHIDRKLVEQLLWSGGPPCQPVICDVYVKVRITFLEHIKNFKKGKGTVSRL